MKVEFPVNEKEKDRGKTKLDWEGNGTRRTRVFFLFLSSPMSVCIDTEGRGLRSNHAALPVNPGFYFGRAIVCSRPLSRHRVRRKITDAHTTVRGFG